MAISVYKTWISAEILTAADLNASFSQVLNNGTDVAFPLTKNGATGGFIFTGLGAGSADGDSVRFQQLPFSVNDFRLTLTTAVPVTTADVTGATTIYASPKTGNAIGLYDGTNWHVRTSAEFSLALGTLTSGKPYDVFCYDNGGTPTLEFLVWTNDTTRATALTTQNGVLVKTGALTRRYLGTFYTTATTTTEDSFAKRFLWNYYNRVLRPMRVHEATSSWSYATATLRQANGATANQLDFMVGYGEDQVVAEVEANLGSDTGSANRVGVAIGLDSTTTRATGCIAQGISPTLNSCFVGLAASYRGFPTVGRHFLTWLEIGNATGVNTWYGTGLANAQSGIHGGILA